MGDYSFGVIPVCKDKNQYYFLLIKHHAGHWAFPKGHAEEGESEVEVAKREFGEETGIKKFKIVPKACFIERYRYKFEDKLIDKTVKYFLAFVKDKTVRIQEKEISDYKWVSFNEALELITYKETDKILEEVGEYLEGLVLVQQW